MLVLSPSRMPGGLGRVGMGELDQEFADANKNIASGTETRPLFEMGCFPLWIRADPNGLEVS